MGRGGLTLSQRPRELSRSLKGGRSSQFLFVSFILVVPEIAVFFHFLSGRSVVSDRSMTRGEGSASKLQGAKTSHLITYLRLKVSIEFN